jgi:hypothetical protein
MGCGATSGQLVLVWVGTFFKLVELSVACLELFQAGLSAGIFQISGQTQAPLLLLQH